MSGEIVFLDATLAAVGTWAVNAMAVTVAAHYWADSKYPLAAFQVPLVDWLYSRDPSMRVVPQEAIDIGGAAPQWVADRDGRQLVRVTQFEPAEDPIGGEPTRFFTAEGEETEAVGKVTVIAPSTGQRFASTLAQGLECPLCFGQWLAFAAALIVYSPLRNPVQWMVYSLSLNFFNGATRHFLWADTDD